MFPNDGDKVKNKTLDSKIESFGGDGNLLEYKSFIFSWDSIQPYWTFDDFCTLFGAFFGGWKQTKPPQLKGVSLYSWAVGAMTVNFSLHFCRRVAGTPGPSIFVLGSWVAPKSIETNRIFYLKASTFWEVCPGCQFGPSFWGPWGGNFDSCCD